MSNIKFNYFKCCVLFVYINFSLDFLWRCFGLSWEFVWYFRDIFLIFVRSYESKRYRTHIEEISKKCRRKSGESLEMSWRKGEKREALDGCGGGGMAIVG